MTPYIPVMRQLILILALSLPAPALAEDEGGASLMERGAKLFFKGLGEELDPALRQLRDFVEEAGPAMENFLQEMGPALTDLFDEVEDFSRFHPPEVLPNGDIIMRRKPVQDPKAQPKAAPEQGKQIDL